MIYSLSLARRWKEFELIDFDGRTLLFIKTFNVGFKIKIIVEAPHRFKPLKEYRIKHFP